MEKLPAKNVEAKFIRGFTKNCNNCRWLIPAVNECRVYNPGQITECDLESFCHKWEKVKISGEPPSKYKIEEHEINI